MSRIPPKQDFRKFLKGSDVVAAKKKAVAGVILQVRENVPGVNSPYIIDFDTDILPGVSSWPVNYTEQYKLSDMISDETGNWPGWMVQLGLCKANNPKTNREVDSLTVVKVLKPQEAAKLRKTKPKYTVSRGAAAVGADEDVPF